MDYASTTPLGKEVKTAMKKVEGVFANPSSLYESGVKAKNILENARKEVAGILNARKDEIVFTSGGTEGNNMIVFGLYNHFSKFQKKLHIVTSTIEHASVLEPIRELESRGVEVSYIKPNSEGLIDPREIKKALKKETFLVSVMYANNEIGTIQPIREIAKVVRDFKKNNQESFIYFHTDACQAGNYLSLDVVYLGVDFMTLDGGKIYGPKGSGAIFRKKIAPALLFIFGGGQESGIRSGTENIMYVVGFAAALRAATSSREKESARLSVLQKYFFDQISKKFPKVSINGGKDFRLPNNINICVPGLDAEFVIFQLDKHGIECSASSACMNLKGESSSYVIREVSGEKCASSSLRFSLGKFSKKTDIDHCLKVLSGVILV